MKKILLSAILVLFCIVTTSTAKQLEQPKNNSVKTNGLIDNETYIKKLQNEISINPADIILLKNGDSIEGVITNADNDNIYINTEFGNEAYKKKDIDCLSEMNAANRPVLDKKLHILQRYNKKHGFITDLDKSKQITGKTAKKPKRKPFSYDENQMKTLKTEVSISPADIIMLKNGDSIEGVIREKNKDIVSIENEHGIKVFNRKNIDYINEISEKDKFSLLHKIEILQKYNQIQKLKKLLKDKEKLMIKTQNAERNKKVIESATGTKDTDLFTLSQNRLNEVVKEFSQFPPDYWRYYHRKNDAVKTVNELNRMLIYTHPAFKDVIGYYIKAFDKKQQELNEDDKSALKEQYKEKYKSLFRSAEQKKLTILNPYDR